MELDVHAPVGKVVEFVKASPKPLLPEKNRALANYSLLMAIQKGDATAMTDALKMGADPTLKDARQQSVPMKWVRRFFRSY